MKRVKLIILMLLLALNGYSQNISATINFIVNTDIIIKDATVVWSPTTFYALPGDLKPGKYYKYELHITSTSNGTNDPNEANKESDEILIEDNPVIKVKLIDSGYTQGDERTFTI